MNLLSNLLASIFILPSKIMNNFKAISMIGFLVFSFIKRKDPDNNTKKEL
jgi:hypothetical protein